MRNRCSQCGHSPRSKWHQVHCLHKPWRMTRPAPATGSRHITRHAAGALCRWRDPDPIQVNLAAQDQHEAQMKLPCEFDGNYHWTQPMMEMK